MALLVRSAAPLHRQRAAVGDAAHVQSAGLAHHAHALALGVVDIGAEGQGLAIGLVGLDQHGAAAFGFVLDRHHGAAAWRHVLGGALQFHVDGNVGRIQLHRIETIRLQVRHHGVPAAIHLDIVRSAIDNRACRVGRVDDADGIGDRLRQRHAPRVHHDATGHAERGRAIAAALRVAARKCGQRRVVLRIRVAAYAVLLVVRGRDGVRTLRSRAELPVQADQFAAAAVAVVNQGGVERWRAHGAAQRNGSTEIDLRVGQMHAQVAVALRAQGIAEQPPLVGVTQGEVHIVGAAVPIILRLALQIELPTTVAQRLVDGQLQAAAQALEILRIAAFQRQLAQ